MFLSLRSKSCHPLVAAGRTEIFLFIGDAQDGYGQFFRLRLGWHGYLFMEELPVNLAWQMPDDFFFAAVGAAWFRLRWFHGLFDHL